ncbi:MAG: hypothetical protein Q8N05_15040 [Bacteroidota bacterium]|nr:hypothetical protein [Bacteroidota bacterium]
MKHFILFFILVIFFGISSYAQKLIGYGGELSVLGIKPNVRMWISKSTGFEFFFGVASELDNLKPDDLETGFKYLHTIIYNRTNRAYLGVVGKWKWIDISNPNRTTSLPVPGVLIGKEWFSKRVNRKGFAIELGYQYGSKTHTIKNFQITPEETFTEFPLILNIRYSFYKKK